jgi:hypothetical protein
MALYLFNKLKEEQMTTNPWLKTREEKLRSLIADEAKTVPIIENLYASVKQLKAKQAFRLALLNQLLEEEIDGDDLNTTK